MPARGLRRWVFVALAILAFIFTLSLLSRRTVTEIPHAAAFDAILDGHISSFNLDVPVRFNWHKSTHKPPQQKNSTSGEASWYSDWRWLNPFSSSVTLDEDRVVLPPLPERPYIYTYYDTSVRRDKETQQIDKALILTWRRAWWAKGFRPVVLTQDEAMSNPHYSQLQPVGMPKALEFELARLMAWGHMGTGLLADMYCLPMGAYDDPILTYLRRAQFAQLTRFEGLRGGMFAGTKEQIDLAIKETLKDMRLSTYTSITEAVNKDLFHIEQPSGLAYYDTETLTKKYSAIADAILKDPNKGRQELNRLMISHLHIVWQNTFHDGIEVLKPLPEHTTALVEPSLHLAQLLAECPETILPSSCPPNLPKCSPCVGSKTRVTQPESFINSSSVYTIATVPHPYTMIMLDKQSDDVTIAHIRRNTDRDAWIREVTSQVLGDGRGGPSRVIALKDAIASEFGRIHSLWFSVEHFPANIDVTITADKVPSNDVQKQPTAKALFPENWLEDIDWHFGFPISRTTVSHGESINPVPLPNRWPKGQQFSPEDKKSSYAPADPTAEQQKTEIQLLEKARKTINSKDAHLRLMRDVAEKWNLADLEAWRFIRAYRARELMEREVYEEEESAYSGTQGARKSRWW